MADGVEPRRHEDDWKRGSHSVGRVFQVLLKEPLRFFLLFRWYFRSVPNIQASLDHVETAKSPGDRIWALFLVTHLGKHSANAT